MDFYYKLLESTAIAIGLSLFSAFAAIASPLEELNDEYNSQHNTQLKIELNDELNSELKDESNGELQILSTAIADADVAPLAAQEAGDAAGEPLPHPQESEDRQFDLNSETLQPDAPGVPDAPILATDDREAVEDVNIPPEWHADDATTPESDGIVYHRAADLRGDDQGYPPLSVERHDIYSDLSAALTATEPRTEPGNALDLTADLKELSFTPIEALQVIAQEPTIPEEAAAAQAQAQAILGAVLSQLNHSPYVFGTPTTVLGSFGDRTQLTGDWGGARLRLPENRVFFDIYATTAAQGVVSGARDDDDDTFTVIQNIDAYLNIVNPWPGAIIHIAFQSKIGDALSNAGSLSPTYYGSAFPVVNPGDYALLSEYYLLQAFAPNFQLILGKANATNFADTNVFANNYRYQFQNASLNNNLMMGSYAPPSMWLAAIAWQPTPWLNIVTSVGDPGSSAENFADNFFEEVLVSQEVDIAYRIRQNPGNFRLGWLYSSQNSTDFSDPFNTFGRNRLIDFRDPIRTQDGAYMVYANFDQYLFTIDTADGNPDPRFTTPRGLGLFGRFGIGPEDSNFINSFFSLGLGAKGVIPGREYDEFGLGWYYLDFANGTIDAINNAPVLSRVLGQDLEGQETGFEAYYNLALTPALQMAFTAQYIIDPLLNNANDAFILGGRLQLSF